MTALRTTRWLMAQEFCRQDARISVFSQQNAGASAARNLGFLKSSNEYLYVLWLDNDDLLVPEALQMLLSRLEAQPEASAACGEVQDVNAEGIPYDNHRFEPLTNRRGVDGFRLVRREPAAPLVFGDLCFHCHVTSPGQVLVRKAALKVTGTFDVTRAYTEDYDLWWRLTMQAGPIAVTPEPVLLYRHHATNSSGNRAAVRRGAADWRWRVLTYPGLSPKQKRLARIGYFYHCLVQLDFALFYLRRGNIKSGLKQAALGVRDMIYYIKDFVRLWRMSLTASRSPRG